MPREERLTSQPPQYTPRERAALQSLSWQHGELGWKLKPCQRDMLSAIQGSQRFKYVIKCARRLGKSFLLCLLAISICIRKPGAQVRYAAPTGKALRKIVKPIMGKILKDCPRHIRPVWNSQDQCYTFPNGKLNPKDPYEGGSAIHIAGVNGGHADDLRGTECDLFLIDEARDIDDLHYLVHDVALPQFLDVDKQVVQGRRLIVASSPAQSKAHDFSIMADEAKAEGYYSHYDIFAGGYSDEIIRMFFKEDGLLEEDADALLDGRIDDIQSTTVKREYLALDVIDSDVAIVGEWSSKFIQEWEPTDFDRFYHRYVFMDMGVQRDLTVVQFARYDFVRAKLYIEDEIVIKGPKVTTPMIAKEIFERTGMPPDVPQSVLDQLYAVGMSPTVNDTAPRKEYAQAYRRIADNSHPLLLNDLLSIYDLAFTATSKDFLHEMVNSLRVWVRSGRLIVNPRCRHTIGALESGVWNEKRTEFARSRTFGHFDAIASLVYGTRGIDTQTNPIPPQFGIDRMNVVILPQPKRLSKAAISICDAFGINPRK
jgi:hypothetical protein